MDARTSALFLHARIKAIQRQDAGDLLLRKIPMQRIITGIVHTHIPEAKIQRTALFALHQASEAYVIGVLKKAQEVAERREAESSLSSSSASHSPPTLTPEDMTEARRERGELRVRQHVRTRNQLDASRQQQLRVSTRHRMKRTFYSPQF